MTKLCRKPWYYIPRSRTKFDWTKKDEQKDKNSFHQSNHQIMNWSWTTFCLYYQSCEGRELYVLPRNCFVVKLKRQSKHPWSWAFFEMFFWLKKHFNWWCYERNWRLIVAVKLCLVIYFICICSFGTFFQHVHIVKVAGDFNLSFKWCKKVKV